jgi:4-aminobutyrate aminotransferase/(S)-3-amino-2-methylpropionate transaminase
MHTNAEMMKRREAAVPRGIGHLHRVFAERAENGEVWDVEGRRHVDFAAGIAVLNTGHRHPRVMAAIARQMERFTHTCFNVAPYDVYVGLAERLNALVPGASPKKTMLLSTGAEAIENAIKIARAHTGRGGVISFQGGFHGRTLLSAGLTGKVDPYKRGFGPFPPEIFHARFPNALHGVSVEDALASLDGIFRSDIEAARVAAIVVEPVQGEGGFNIAPPRFLQALRALCDTHGIVLIVDEIQTGFARTGRLFASEYADIEPDLMTLAKALGGGMPIAAVTGRAEIMDAPAPGGLGGTYAGNPLACAAALAVLDVIAEDGLCARAAALGSHFVRRLEALAGRQRCIVDVRGLGAMVAMELAEDGDVGRPAAALTRALVTRAGERGLLLLSCGTHGNVIRFLPALTMTPALADEGFAILEACLDELVAVPA